MYKNYFYLFRCVNELNRLIGNSKIFEIYSQEKDKLFFRLPLNGNVDFHMIVSVNSQKPMITVRQQYHKAKKNTVGFFDDSLPSKIKSVSIAEGDRIIKFELENGALYIVFRGAGSNVLLIDKENSILPFKKEDEAALNNLAVEISKTIFTNSLEWVSQMLGNSIDQSSLKKLPFIGKEIIREMEYRQDFSKHSLLTLIREILNEPIAVYFDEDMGKQCFCPVSFKSYHISKEAEPINNYFEAVNKYFSMNYSRAGVANVKSEIDKYLHKEIERLSNKLNNLKARLDSGSKEKLYRYYADLLLTNINQLRKGMKQITITDYANDEEIKISLDEKLSPSQNTERYFEKSRNEKIEYHKSGELYSASQKEYERLIKIRERFEAAGETSEYLKIKTELKMNIQQPHVEDKKEKFSFRHFLVDGKYHVYVGKDSRNNDALTTKFAKQNDYWFHARSVSGSHTVLRVENSKEAIPKSVLQKAASIAAFYSKAKTSKLAPVAYAFKKYVVKNSRHEPGQVTLTKENVLLVRPEIPKDCEMLDE